MDEVMDLDGEEEEDTFLAAPGDMNVTAQLAAQVRRDTGIRSPSPPGSVTSEEDTEPVPRSKTRKSRGTDGKKEGNSSQALKIQLKAMKETMKLMNYRGKKRKAETSSSESEDDQEPILVEKTFKVKDNGHDILDFKIRNSHVLGARPRIL